MDYRVDTPEFRHRIGGKRLGIQQLSSLSCRMKNIRRNKSRLGGQDRAQFPETIGLWGRLELNKESSCYSHKSRRKRAVGCQTVRTTPVLIRLGWGRRL